MLLIEGSSAGFTERVCRQPSPVFLGPGGLSTFSPADLRRHELTVQIDIDPAGESLGFTEVLWAESRLKVMSPLMWVQSE